METKFTKGDWEATIADCSDYLLCAVISESEDRVICHTTVDNKMSKEEQKANAKLIAAAPELLEALLNIENDNNSIPKTIWDLRNSAIKKATE